MERRARWARLVVVALTGLAPLTVPGAMRPVSAATMPAELRVAASRCTATADGSADRPFCTISAAASVVQPGQTVVVEPGIYNESVHITRSGTSSAPITFVAVTSVQGMVRVGGVTALIADSPFVVSSQHDVVLRGFVIMAASPRGAAGVEIDNSSDVTVDGGAIREARGPGVAITGTSSNVTVSRVVVHANTAVRVDAGVTGTLVSTNQLWSPQAAGPAVEVSDAPDTVITSNTVISNCKTGIAVRGAAAGTLMYNNVVETAYRSAGGPRPCATPSDAVGISVAADSLPQTVADYNLIDPIGGGPLYAWASTGYSDLAAFTAATGQGHHDIAADPQVGPEVGGDDGWFAFRTSSPALDSANAGAPGELATDLLGNSRADDPAVANTGTEFGYADRGALEELGTISPGGVTLNEVPGGSTLDVVASSHPKADWPTTGPVGELAYQFDGQAYPVTTTAQSLTHTFAKAGTSCVHVYFSSNGFRRGYDSYISNCVLLGAVYTPVSPTRILDTRAALGVPTTTPVAPGADVVLPIGPINTEAAADITAVVATVTVTQPTASGFLTVYPDGQELPTASNLNFSAGQTVPNLVTIALVNGNIRFHNGSGGTVHIVADLAGYYSGTGSGFASKPPVRVLDTRKAIGTPTTSPVPAHGIVRLDLSGVVPTDTTAVVLNVTATAPAAAGFLTVYPDGQSAPTASNLNFSSGQTVANLVLASVHNGILDFFNGSDRPVHVIADLSGHFGTSETQRYVPSVPQRILDTRHPGAGEAPAVPPHATVAAYPNIACDNCPLPTALVANVTVTQPTTNGYLTAYPNGQPRPTTSTLNFTPGHTVANLVTAANGTGGLVIYNGSNGTIQIVVDQEGFYFDTQ
ncbi:right-handed parallel beta-helix repeat-containing protein [Actinoplanes subtropicus]|uniref:right-handed parallel beta-helix repeat-containing protein n=1 Tax=Actinoplanes subtropicus TaxID=543632 RepID=UPI0004C3DC8D|nr:right-handed parallel beta-helix repeat-containing protein [Actinoplanes subtropicus]